MANQEEVNRMWAEAQAFVEQKRKEGWTRADFARAIVQMFTHPFECNCGESYQTQEAADNCNKCPDYTPEHD